MKNITPLILIIVSVGLFFTYIDPQYKRLQTVKAEHAQYKSALTNSKEIISNRNALAEKYDSFSTADIEKLEKMIPDKVDNVRLVMDIAGIAAQSGITISKINVVENQTLPEEGVEQKLNTISLGFSFTADYTNMKEFMQNLEKSLRIVDVESIVLKTDEKGLNTYEVVLKTYWVK